VDPATGFLGAAAPRQTTLMRVVQRSAGRTALLVGLALVTASAVLRGVAWAAAVPAWHGPDETAHYAYVERLANGGFPPHDRGHPMLSPAVSAALSATSAEAFGLADPDRPRGPAGAAPREPPGLSQRGHGALGANNYPPAYYALALPLYVMPGLETATTRLFALRLLSAALAGALVLATFALVREATGRDGLALAGAALVTLPPMMGQASGIVNPDVLLALAAAGMAWGLVRRLRGENGAWTFALIAGSALVAAAAKPAGGVVVAALGASFLLIPAALGSRRVAAVLTAAAAAAGIVLTGLALAGGERVQAPLAFSARYLWDFYLPRFPSLTGEPAASRAWIVWVESGIGSFGWQSAWLPPWAYWLGLASVGAAVVASVAGLRRSGPGAVAIAAASAAAIVLYAAALHLAEVESLLRGPGQLLQGRYLTAIVPVAVCGFLASAAGLPPRLRVLTVGGALAIWGLLSLLAFDAVVTHVSW
jgi:hypothetical protein